MRDERKHHDSWLQRREQERSQRRSVGRGLKDLPLKLLFWPDELDRLLSKRPGVGLGSEQE